MAETMLESVFINIPTPIVTDILARLPPSTLIGCRCVCKAWLELISQPEFVNCLLKSPFYLIVNNLSSNSPDSACLSLVEVEDEINHHGVQRIARTDRVIPRIRESIGVTMIGSIDGFVCINDYAYQYEFIHVWNPIIKEFITVQTPGGGEKHPNVTTYGFGISSGKYLVVRIFQEIEKTDSATYSRQIRNSTCHVYTIGDGVWKSIGHAPYLYGCRDKGLFCNGNLHWFISDEDSPVQICCFDLEKELFQPFPPPPELCQGHLATFNLYKGCLSVCDNTSDYDMVIW